jgi:hypothetical protein
MISMAEVTKEVKIVLIIDAIASLIFAFLYLVIPEIYASLVDPIVFDPYYWRAFGGTLLVLAIMALIALKRAEGEQVKIIIEFAILWSVVILGLNIWELIVLPLSPTYTETTWIDSVLLIVLIILNSYFYNRDLK